MPTAHMAALQMKECVEQGHLLPDQLILRVLRERFMKMAAEGVDRFLLDGFPRTADQAAALEQIADVQLALNLDLREEVRVLVAATAAATCGTATVGTRGWLPVAWP